ncbi:Crp/Fnr family transcriptional regulator [uncultured Microscilla sp.]|uniref:Crp/Fnr family transcriptional regulator n=1 Tax=uncultured Microscilla sp. TaxID=432653 RepID=UPI0026234977|nr:Crp/Fnr family transcriptional regulator [uncultured Microscilla sp.]
MHPLFDHISQEVAITPDDFNQTLHYFDHIHCKKKQLMIRAGELVSRQYFVIKGCLRSFLIDDNDREYTVQFGIENWWMSDFTAYFTGAKSILYLECLENCELLAISKNSMDKLYIKVPTLEHFFRQKLERAFVSFQKRIISNLHKSAEERYYDFLAQYPDIEQRVRNYQIASYLGITPESLSRIRTGRTQKK